MCWARPVGQVGNGDPVVLKKIDVDKLRVGMYITELCGSWMEHPFWNTKFTLEDPSDLARIRDSGIRELWIDVSRGDDVDGGISPAEVQARNESELLAASTGQDLPAPRVSASEELLRARKICAAARQAVESMFKEARMGRSVDTQALAPMVEEISSSVMRHPGALVSLARLKSKDDYTYMHSVAVCGLMISLARRLGLDETATREAGLAGLVHDLGKAAVPLTVLNKPGKLTDEEFRVMRGHPGAGHAMLLEAGGQGTSRWTWSSTTMRRSTARAIRTSLRATSFRCSRRWVRYATSMMRLLRTGRTRRAGIPAKRCAR